MGRELDALVAEKVMGIETDGEWIQGRPFDNTIARLPHYSTSIVDAWMVVEKMKEIDRHFILWTWSNIAQVIDSEIDGKDYYADEKAEEMPEAICLAALKAVGHDV